VAGESQVLPWQSGGGARWSIRQSSVLAGLAAWLQSSVLSNLPPCWPVRISAFVARFCTLLYTILFAACPLPTHPTNINVTPALWRIYAQAQDQRGPEPMQEFV